MKWKMILLIAVGVVLAIMTMLVLQRFEVLYWDVYLFVAISFYPLAIVYGRSVMIDVFYSIKNGPYRPVKVKPGSQLRVAADIVNMVVAAIAFIFVGWIYGVYNAYKRYQMSRGYIVK